MNDMQDERRERQQRVVTPRKAGWVREYEMIAERRFSLPRLAPLGLVGGGNIPSLEAVYVDQLASRSLVLPLSTEQSVSAADAVAVSDCVLVVGDSGIGKSTLLTVTALRSLRNGRLPFLFELASVEDALVEATGGKVRSGGLRFDTIMKLIQSELEFLGVITDRPAIESALQDGRVDLLLDGLNEFRDARLRNMLLAIIPAWRTRWPGMRVVLSSTTSTVDDGSVVPPHGMDILRLAPLGFEEAGGFLDTFIRVARPDLPERPRSDLWQPTLRKLRGSPEIFGYPLYLTAIAVTLISNSHLDTEEGLHSSYDVLKRIGRWLAEHHSETTQPDVSADALYDLVSAVAFEMSTSDSSPRALIGLREVSQAVGRLLPGLAARVNVEHVIAEISSRGGLVRRRWGDVTMLELLRDFFTCQYLSRHESENGVPVWRDWMSRGIAIRENRGILRLLPMSLLENAGSGTVREFYDAAVSGLDNVPLDLACEAIAVLARALRDLSLRGFPASGLSDNWRDAIARLTATVKSGLRGTTIALQSRVSLATASSLSSVPLPSDFRSQIIWFASPEPFMIGAQSNDPMAPNFDEDAAPWERRPQESHLCAFGIGRFLVTVTEFEEFLESGGYEELKYWTNDGRTWLLESGFRKPLDWELQLTGRSCPVTGVSYYEAEAYSSWIRDSGLLGRLPSELEWEYTARHGVSTRFPWGESITYGDSAEANWAGAGLRLKTPVGLFEAFATSDGVHDLVGNVEEWCADEWDADQEIYRHVGMEGKRVVKGGSCIRYRRLCRPAYRSRILAWARYHTLGFRLAFDHRS